MASNTIDFETERLVIEIQRQDLRKDLESTQDQLLVSLIRDQLAALDVESQEVQLRENRHTGQVLQQSMYAAMLSDSRAIAEERRHEQQAVEDRAMAAQLAGCPPPTIPDSVRKQIAGGQFEDARLTQLEETISERDVDIGENRNEQNGALNGIRSGQDHSDIQSVNLERYMAVLSLDEGRPAVECVVCLNNLLASQTMTLTCGDVWCRDCLIRLFQDATLNEGVWPPKCCRQEIPVDNLQHILSTDLRNRFARKSIEWSTIDRVYCLEPTCSEFIPSESIEGRKAECPACQRNTCSECKSAYHEKPPCSETTTNDEVLREMARTNGWQNCPTCHRIVEITHGCNHMT
jgi:IBR domain, a half RING-finger domain